MTIGAASILAKVTRDRMMITFDRIFPQYGSPGTRATARANTSGPCGGSGRAHTQKKFHP